jgi:hypothetical protein
MKFARTELINQIANVYLNTRQRFESDSVLVVNNIQYCLSEYGNRFLAIAYVQKAMFDSSHSVAFNIVKVNFTEKVTAENRRNDASISSGKLDQRNVIDSLTEFIQKRDLTRSLIKYASRNLLVFSTKEALVENVADCYVFPIDKESDHVLGCLNFEKPFRRNILDGRIVKDYKLEFTNANFIWVYVY